MVYTRTLDIVGVDPGLVDTGVMRMIFHRDDKRIALRPSALHKATASDVVDEVKVHLFTDRVFIEGYRPRSNLSTDQKMVSLVADIHKGLKGSKVINNTGIKKVVKPRLLDLLGMNAGLIPVTNHQDIESAMRIAVLGALKDPDMNAVIYQVVEDHLDNQSWAVTGL